MKIYIVMDDDLYGYETPMKAFTTRQAAEEFAKGRNFGVADLNVIEMELEE